MRKTRISFMLAVVTIATSLVGPIAGACGAAPLALPMTFDPPSIVDPVRAGGEPSVLALRDGTLIYSSHAGTTHLYKPLLPDADFVAPYNGTVYLWRSEDAGRTWRYVGFEGTEVGPHAVSGFSDPSLAEDAAGNVYASGINLANVYVAKSSDSGKRWEGNPTAALLTDRQWLAADRENLVYMLASQPGRAIVRSTDGGKTWNWGSGVGVPATSSPITVDPTDGSLYVFPMEFGELVKITRFPRARDGDFTKEFGYIFDGLPRAHGFINSSAVDAAGNVYVASNTGTEIRVAYSTDKGYSWTTSVVRRGINSVLWPWLSAGADGRVAVSWLESDREDIGFAQGAFRVWAAATVTGHGWTDACGTEHEPEWVTSLVTPEPMHVGGVCEFGTACNGFVDVNSDRRLGDYHTNSITPDGQLVIAYANTTFKPTSAISRPAFARQAGGVNFWGD